LKIAWGRPISITRSKTWRSSVCPVDLLCIWCIYEHHRHLPQLPDVQKLINPWP